MQSSEVLTELAGCVTLTVGAANPNEAWAGVMAP